MMLSIKNEEVLSCRCKFSSPSSYLWLFLSFEFLVGVAISIFFSFLAALKSFLPKPPRDLTGDVVLIAGACSPLGESLADEFARDGCSVLCVDESLSEAEGLVNRLTSDYPRIEEIGRKNGKQEVRRNPESRTMSAYKCDLQNHEDIRRLAGKVKDEVGKIDVLVTCLGNSREDIFDTASKTLMSHYWTVLAFLPSMLHRGKAHIIGIMPISSTEEAFAASRAAIAGVMESLGEELGNHDSHLRFLTVAPKAETRLMRLTERQVARDVVQAVQRDQSSLTLSWGSKALYEISCVLYNTITVITQWLYSQGCDYSQ